MNRAALAKLRGAKTINRSVTAHTTPFSRRPFATVPSKGALRGRQSTHQAGEGSLEQSGVVRVMESKKIEQRRVTRVTVEFESGPPTVISAVHLVRAEWQQSTSNPAPMSRASTKGVLSKLHLTFVGE